MNILLDDLPEFVDIYLYIIQRQSVVWAHMSSTVVELLVGQEGTNSVALKKLLKIPALTLGALAQTDNPAIYFALLWNLSLLSHARYREINSEHKLNIVNVLTRDLFVKESLEYGQLELMAKCIMSVFRSDCGQFKSVIKSVIEKALSEGKYDVVAALLDAETGEERILTPVELNDLNEVLTRQLPIPDDVESVLQYVHLRQIIIVHKLSGSGLEEWDSDVGEIATQLLSTIQRDFLDSEATHRNACTSILVVKISISLLLAIIPCKSLAPSQTAIVNQCYPSTLHFIQKCALKQGTVKPWRRWLEDLLQFVPRLTLLKDVHTFWSYSLRVINRNSN